ncbi:diguanylate cyclase (GGDEF)-like protein [Salsuginibacillus halophilus]|uniref:Diguanylate cyclase (GGDEF)-like protein n=1 Tax=Salsuginibacillus halophilus TaxID=517424 RepID=A0A2P8H862_9BACI|nr:response regulator [Salsuginibacillus halophilus]PSL42416.1 diguanylate cyclase (GGDEF)-like protein [Salsuginibacillus halophilus]
MEKYQKMIYDRIRKTMRQWNEEDRVSEKALYRFFHNIKGTAGTIGMLEVHNIAAVQLDSLEEDSFSLWNKEEWLRAIAPLLPYVDDPDQKETLLEEVGGVQEPEEDTPMLLIIDDDMDFVTYLKDLVESNGYQALVAMNGERGVELYYEMNPRMLILDYYLPDINGVEILQQIMDKAKHDFTPVVMLSGKAETEAKIRSYELGASDFISKPINHRLFFPFIKNRLEAQERIWASSMQDELTGAKNRKFLYGELEALTDKLRRGYTAVLTLILCDLDHFKKINDTYGHTAGDEALRHFVKVVTSFTRPGDTTARYGGEEFALVLPESDEANALRIIERIQQALKEDPVPGYPDIELYFSAGIRPVIKGKTSPEQLLEDADRALYAAKHQGRDRAVVYHDELKAVKDTAMLHVIIVDDDNVVREMLEQFMKHRQEVAGHPARFHRYPDGQAFIEDDWYQEGDYYFLLLDGMMPRMDGLEVLQHLRTHYSTDRVLISMLTARTEEKDIARALQLGADDYMAKPFRVREVFARMERLVERVF